MSDERARRANLIAKNFDKQGNEAEAAHWREKAAYYEQAAKK